MQFPFEGPQKTRWSNLPSGIFQRQGLRMGDLTPSQRAAVTNLLSVALSRDGYRKVTDIMRGDEVLRTEQHQVADVAHRKRGGGGRGRGGPGGGVAFGEAEYYLAFLGTPSATAPWMLQFGGHHLAINLTLAGSQATMAPSLPAAQPATYTVEGRTVRPLGNENDKAFALINALNAEQRGQAILGSRVADLVLGPGQDGRTIQPEGIRAAALSAAQQTMLLDLAREWVGIMNDAFAEPRMAEIRANLPNTYFAWSGPTTNGSAAYSAFRGRRSSSNTHRRTASITSTRSIAIRPTTMAQSSRASRGATFLIGAALSVALGAGVSAHRPRRVPADGADRDPTGPRAP